MADREEEKRKKMLRRNSSGSSVQLVQMDLSSHENTPLTSNNGHVYSKLSHGSLADSVVSNSRTVHGNGNGGDTIDDSLDFFRVIADEMDKINKFFVGKLAQLRVSLETIQEERRNAYRNHHTSSSDSAYLLRLRDIYVDLAALRSYCDLNKTGFYKIIKKYDKVMQDSTLEGWLTTVERQSFATNTEPVMLMEAVTSLVSRDKLIEWERFATEQQSRASDDIFPSVRFPQLLFSFFLFALSLLAPRGGLSLVSDPVASRCLSLLLLAVLLWITEALPYFATALLIPLLVVWMRVLKDPSTVDGLMTPANAATFVIDHLFNHTTLLLLGGYTISTAFARCQLELRVAAYLQRRFGSNPR